MAGPRATGIGPGVVAPKLERSALDLQRDKKQGEILSGLGLADPNQLPEYGRDALRRILDGKQLAGVDPTKAAEEIKAAVARGARAHFDAGSAPTASLKVHGHEAVAIDGGRFKLAGALAGDAAKKDGATTADAPVAALMGRLGIDSTNFGPEVKTVLAGAKGQDLGHAGIWAEFGRRLAEAQVKDTPLREMARAHGVTASAAPSAATAVDGVTANADLGLAKSALTEGAKAKVNTAATPDAIMGNEAVRDPSAAGTREHAVQNLLKALGDAGLSAEQQGELRPVLDQVLQEGQLRAKNGTTKSWAIVRAAGRAMTGRAMPDDSVPTHEGYEKTASYAAAWQILQLAEHKTGTSLSSSKIEDLRSVVQDYTSLRAAKSTSRSGTADRLGGLNLPGRSTAGADQAKGPTKAGAEKIPESKRLAHEYAQKIGLDPAHPGSAHTVKDVENAFAQVVQGAKTDADVALRALKWIDRKTGDTNGALSRHLEMILADAPKDSPVAATAKEFALGRLATCAAMGPDAYREAQAAQRGGAGGMPPGGMPPGGMPPGGSPFGPGGVPMPYGLAEQQMNSIGRTVQTQSVLYDPSLSFEDKMVLFMLLQVSFTNQDRLRKLREIADLEKKTALDKQAGGPGGPVAAGPPTAAPSGAPAKPGKPATGPAAGAAASKPAGASAPKPGTGDPIKASEVAAKATPASSEEQPPVETPPKASPRPAAAPAEKKAAAVPPRAARDGATPPADGAASAQATASSAGGTTPAKNDAAPGTARPAAPPDSPGEATAKAGSAETPQTRAGGPDAASGGPGIVPNYAPPGGQPEPAEGPKSKETLMAELDRFSKTEDIQMAILRDFMKQADKHAHEAIQSR